MAVRSVRVLERRGHMVRLDYPGTWFSLRNLGPCSECGNRMLRYRSSSGLFCEKCYRGRSAAQLGDHIDVIELLREIRDQEGKANGR